MVFLSNLLSNFPMKLISEIRLENLETLVREAGTAEALAEKSGISPVYISQIRGRALEAKTGNVRNLGDRAARKLEQGTGKPHGWMDADHASIRHVQGGSASLESAPGIIGKVPVVSWVQAGEYVEAVERWDADEWIETSAPVLPHTFALRVKGDSMEPTFPDGVVIIIEPDLEANPGDFVVARNGGNEATFKQLVRDGADLYLKPLNERYPIKPLGSSHIVGVVREMIKKFR